MKIIFPALIILMLPLQGNSQTIETLIRELPSHYSILTTWGLRPEFDETSENIYFLDKLVGEVFKINLQTRQISAVTNQFYHAGIFRVLCLKNGDLLLGIGGKDFDPANPEKHRHKLGMYILKKDDLKNPIFLGEYFDEGPAISRHNMRIAWTLPGQREICIADIEYKDGIPRLVNKKKIISYADSSAYVRLETQDFRPPHDNELIYTHYWGDETDAFYHAETYGFNLETGEYINYTQSPGSYDEAEGIFPCGKYMMIESDRHQAPENRLRWRVDVYRLKLDGSGEAERWADFTTRYPNRIRSDNPVIDRTGRYMAVQFGFMAGAGDGQGIFLFDIEEFHRNQKSSGF
jgi:hypothetical protein